MIETKWLSFYSCFEFKTTLLSALTMIIVMYKLYNTISKGKNHS